MGLESAILKIKNRVQGSSTFGPIASFFTYFQGRSTTFAILFALEGIVLIGVAIWGFFHKGFDLTGMAQVIGAMAAFNGLIQTTMVAHSTKEDWMAIKQQQMDTQTACNPPAPGGNQ